jgi:hypothetical protein
MATRCNVIVEDEYSRIQIYLHWDGYPKAVIADISQALGYAWPLPRFEASEFAAAIVRAWKDIGGGNIDIDGSPKGFELVHGDIEWLYVISFDEIKGEPVINIYDWHPYWFEKANVKRKSFRPKVTMTIPFSNIPTLKLTV